MPSVRPGTILAPLEGRLEAAHQHACLSIRAGRRRLPPGLLRNGQCRVDRTAAGGCASASGSDAGLFGQERSAAHSGMGGVASTDADAQARRELARFGPLCWEWELL